MRKTKHYVKLVRFRIEEAYVEVSASNDKDANALALDLMGEARWAMRPFDEDAYEPFAEFILERHDLEADHGSVAAGKRWLKSEESHDEFRYCFLKADVGSGEGNLVNQPWIHEQDSLWIEDVTGDWIADINRLREGDDDPGPEGGKVMPFPKRVRSDDDEPPPGAA